MVQMFLISLFAVYLVTGDGLKPLPQLSSQQPESGAEKNHSQIRVRQEPIHTPLIQVNVDLVVIYVAVVDPYGRFVIGLGPENFQVFDEKVQQTITNFSTEDTPVSVCVVFDSSGSMGEKIQKSKEALFQFFKTANPQDEFMLITFSDRPLVIAAFTSKYEDLQNCLLLVQKASGKTALMDALYLGLAETKKASTSRKAMLLISDGGENNSRYTKYDVKRVLKETDVQIYSIGIFEPLALRARTPEEASGPSFLAELAEISGGRMFSVEDVNELPDVAEKISIELRNQYVITYRPSNLVRDGSWRRVKVKLLAPKGLPPLSVYARTGYYAPR